MDNNNIKGISADKVNEPELAERPESFDNKRLEGETYEDYRARRVQVRKYTRQSRFFKSMGDDNRAQRRKKTKFRATKPLKRIRGKYMMGNVNVTYAIKHGISLNHFMRVAKLGLSVDDLTSIGKEFNDKYREVDNNE